MEQKLLIVDDEAHIRLLLERALLDFEDEGVETLGRKRSALRHRPLLSGVWGLPFTVPHPGKRW